jgi:dTDP-4-dehydrorhamnose 3,5-epimerase
MQFIPTLFPDVLLIKPHKFADQRGYFMETSRTDLFAVQGIGPFVQSNQSGSHRHVLRGLHYQLERPQGKLVSVNQGALFDVVVDVRKHSATFGQWYGVELSAENALQLWVPPGFAHGFYALSEWAECSYLCTEYFNPASQMAVRWDDPALNISWPIPAGVQPILSSKDSGAPLLAEAQVFA